MKKARTPVRDAFIADESIVDPTIEYSLVHSIPYVQLEGEYLRLLDDAQLASDDVVYEQAARKLDQSRRTVQLARCLLEDRVAEHRRAAAVSSGSQCRAQRRARRRPPARTICEKRGSPCRQATTPTGMREP